MDILANLLEKSLSMDLPGVEVWSVVYVVGKLGARWKGGEPSWDIVCLLHNALSVLAGGLALWQWDSSDSTCGSLGTASALVISLQALHCVTDFVFYGSAMLKEPVFIAHHVVLLLAALVLPSCPGCHSTVTAFTVAEFGSAAIAIDAQWRKLGLHSRGSKRLLFFGGSRILNLYLLYHILIVTPTTQYFTLTSRGADRKASDELVTLNVPVCMMASIGGSGLMLVINGITWFRMFGAYRKHRGKQVADATKKNMFKRAVDAQLMCVFLTCTTLRIADHVVEGWSSPMGEVAAGWLLLLSVGLFLAEPTITVIAAPLFAEHDTSEAAGPSSGSNGDRKSKAKAGPSPSPERSKRA